MKILILILITFSIQAYSKGIGSEYQCTKNYAELAQTKTLIDNVPPIKNQLNYGLCVPMAVSSQLEAYKCKELLMDCRNIKPEHQYSVLELSREKTDLLDHNYIKLNDGNNSLRLYEELKKKIDRYGKLSVLTDACFPLNIIPLKEGQTYQETVQEGMDYVKRNYQRHQSMEDCGPCSHAKRDIAKNIKEYLGLDTSVEFILNKLSMKSFDQFLSELLRSRKCPDNIKNTSVVPFEISSYDSHSNFLSVEDGINKIRNILKSGNTFSLGFCARPRKSNGQYRCGSTFSKNGHETLVNGIKDVIMPNGQRKTMVRFHNSWGQEWQDNNCDGWVDLNNLLEIHLSNEEMKSMLSVTFAHNPNESYPEARSRKMDFSVSDKRRLEANGGKKKYIDQNGNEVWLTDEEASKYDIVDTFDDKKSNPTTKPQTRNQTSKRSFTNDDIIKMPVDNSVPKKIETNNSDIEQDNSEEQKLQKYTCVTHSREVIKFEGRDNPSL